MEWISTFSFSLGHLYIFLDRHRPTPEAQSELWYTEEVPEEMWIQDWCALADRFKGANSIIGADLHNEPRGRATWGDDVVETDWRLAAERCGNEILKINPDWFIIVEGIEAVEGIGYWWGGNLMAAGSFPVRLSNPAQLVYSPHDYPSSVHAQPWLNGPDEEELHRVWDRTWGYLKNSTPILLGEFGCFLTNEDDRNWLKAMVTYLDSNALSFSFWSWNPNSGDTGGLLLDDWTTMHEAKIALLSSLLPEMACPPTAEDGLHISSASKFQLSQEGSVVEISSSANQQQVCIRVDDDWETGCIVRGSFSPPSSGCRSWNVHLTISTKESITIENIWNAVVLEQSPDGFFCLGPESYNKSPDSPVEFGFQMCPGGVDLTNISIQFS